MLAELFDRLRALVRSWLRPLRRRRGPSLPPFFAPGRLTRQADAGVDPDGLVFAAVDLETTGLDPRRDRVCEIAVVRFRADGTVLDEYASLVDPQRPMDATEFHGLDATHVAGAPTFAELLPEIERQLGDAVVVAHNLAFEDAFLAAEYARAGRRRPPQPGLCTLIAARAQLDGPGYALGVLHRSLTGARLEDAHTALGDSRATARLLAALLAQSPGPLRYLGPVPIPAASSLPPSAPSQARGRIPGRPQRAGSAEGSSAKGSSTKGSGGEEVLALPRHVWREEETDGAYRPSRPQRTKTSRSASSWASSDGRSA